MVDRPMRLRHDRVSIRNRTKARAWFLHAHYQWESEGRRAGIAETLARLSSVRLIARGCLPYLNHLAESYDERGREVDQAISRSLEHWTLKRLSIIDRGILRMGATELLATPELSFRLVITEAVRLGDQYGGGNSGRFVNGVLDAIHRDLQSPGSFATLG